MPDMGMLNSFSRLVSLFGLAGVLWAGAILLYYPSFSVVRDGAARALRGGQLSRTFVRDVLPALERPSSSVFSRARVKRDAALILINIAEGTQHAKTSEEADQDLAAADAAVRSALSVEPGNGLLWLALYSLANTRNGVASSNFEYLAESYSRGPLEGWIAVRRNRLALAAIALLRAELRQKVTLEFAALLGSGFVDIAVATFEGVGSAEQLLLLDAIRPVSPLHLEAFAKRLRLDGLMVEVPGVQMPERVWR